MSQWEEKMIWNQFFSAKILTLALELNLKVQDDTLLEYTKQSYHF